MRTPILLFLPALSLGLGSVACGQADKPETPPEVADVFEQLLLPPNPEFVSRSGSRDALQLVLRSTATPEQVREFYRRSLAGGDWRVVSDRTDPEGVQAIYAERNGRPLWIRIAADGTGSRVELAGAVVKLHRDSTPPAPEVEVPADSIE